MRQKIEKHYHPSIDAIRSISILAVLLIHTTIRALQLIDLDIQKGAVTLFLNQSARFAVPLFFMVSGFVLEMNYKGHGNFILYLKKRINKIFVPFIFWSLIYYYFVYTTHSKTILEAILTGDASYQLYFLPSLLIFYVAFPILHSLYFLISNRWVLLVAGILQLLLLYHEYFVQPLNFVYPISVSLLNYMYFIVGIIAFRNHTKLTKWIHTWRLLLCTSVVSLAMYVFLEGMNLYSETKNYLFIYTQWRPSIFVYSLVVAAVLYYYAEKISVTTRIVRKVAQLSFFVFFVHVIVIELTWSILGEVLFENAITGWMQLLANTMFFTIVTGVSFCTAYLAHKIPKLSKITG